MTTDEKPLAESYWVVPGKLLAGGYPIAYADELLGKPVMAAFLEAGFDTFFDLTEAGEMPSYEAALQTQAQRYGIPVRTQRFAIRDKGLPAREEMLGLLDGLDKAIADGHKTYLHCLGGIGRTGTAVGCWLVRHGMRGEQAVVRLNELYRASAQSNFFPRSPENPAQVRFILDWSKAERG